MGMTFTGAWNWSSCHRITSRNYGGKRRVSICVRDGAALSSRAKRGASFRQAP